MIRTFAWFCIPRYRPFSTHARFLRLDFVNISHPEAPINWNDWPVSDVANLLTPDCWWKSVDKRGRNFARLARVCRAHPGRGRPIVCPVKRTQRGIIRWRVTYMAAKANRGWIAYEHLAGDSRDECWTIVNYENCRLPPSGKGDGNEIAFRARRDDYEFCKTNLFFVSTLRRFFFHG